MKWKAVKIQSCVSKVSNVNPNVVYNDDYFSYVDISSVDSSLKTITGAQTISGNEAPSRARQLLKEGDILVSTVRPNLNAVAFVTNEFDDSVGSTGFCVLRSERALLNPRYLFNWVRSSTFVSDMIKKATGASYPAVSDTIIKESIIPLPPLHIQEQIANTLDKADAFRRKDQELLAKYDELAQAIFYDMFGDPVRNERGWEVKKLKDLSTKIHSGNTPKGGSNVYVEKGITFFRSQNVWKNKLEYDEIAYIDEKTHKSMNKSSLHHRDILMTKTGRINTENSSLGRAALFQGNDNTANVNGHVYLIRLQKNQANEFVLHILTTKAYRNLIREVCVGGIDKRQINKDHIEEFPIIYPPLNLQNNFVNKLLLIQKQRNYSEDSVKKSEDLFNKLMNLIFS